MYLKGKFFFKQIYEQKPVKSSKKRQNKGESKKSSEYQLIVDGVFLQILLCMRMYEKYHQIKN